MAGPPRKGHIPLSNPPNPPAASSSFSTGYADVSELDKYRLISNIGKGSFGVISKVQRIEDGKEFALKQLDYSKMTEKDRKQILAEVNILENLKHRNIVQLFQKIKDPKNERIYIVMEYCTSGDLGTLIRRSSRSGVPLLEDKIWNIFLQIVLALHHCHWPNERNKNANGRAGGSSDPLSSGQVLHRDLKPENVFLSDDFVKLGDFGLSKAMGSSMFTDTYVGTPLYMPPEILAENRYDTKSDIWSLGCVLHEMCTFTSPFATATTQAELIQMVKSGRLPPIPSQYSRTLNNVVQAMLNLNPTRRPSTRDLLEIDEMKMQRKCFTLQNQTSILMARKAELEAYETRIRARAQALVEREQKLLQRESLIEARESAANEQEEKNQVVQDTCDKTTEVLRSQWDKCRDQQMALQAREQALESRISAFEQEEQQAKQKAKGVRPHVGLPRRPPLEERNTAPVASSSRLPRMSMAYDDTPTKIPIAPDSPNPLDRRLSGLSLRNVTPLRKNNTKSMGNLRLEAQARAAEEADNDAPFTHQTPARPTLPRRGTGHRSSIGSPGELERIPYCEDISMRTYIATPNPNMAGRAGRVSSATSSSSSSAQSLANGRQKSTSSDENNTVPSERPSRLPAPSFIYREAATPAKWGVDDPDLPSPFIRRASTAPVPAMPERDRQPLGSMFGANTVSSGAPIPPKKVSAAPRQRSGTMHRDVLKANAGRGSVEGATTTTTTTTVAGRTRPSGGR